jgi:hypothetical protein
MKTAKEHSVWWAEITRPGGGGLCCGETSKSKAIARCKLETLAAGPHAQGQVVEYFWARGASKSVRKDVVFECRSRLDVVVYDADDGGAYTSRIFSPLELSKLAYRLLQNDIHQAIRKIKEPSVKTAWDK